MGNSIRPATYREVGLIRNVANPNAVFEMMINESIPAKVREFLVDHIDTIAQLEALMLLRSAGGDWTIARVAARLYVSDHEATLVVAALVESKLVKSDRNLIRYEPRDQQQRDVVDLVAETYARSLVPVTKIVHEKGSGVRKFAEAFKIRKGK